MTSKKAVICIDNGYFSKLCMAHGIPDVGIKRFTKYIAEKSCIDKHFVYIYDCMPYQSKRPTPKERERYANKDRFFSRMKKNGFEIRLGKLQKIGDKFTQKKVDTLWTADIAKLAFRKEMNTVILITGDSDFVPGIEVAREFGVHTVLWYGESEKTGTSFDLIKNCDEVHKITKPILYACKMQP